MEQNKHANFQYHQIGDLAYLWCWTYNFKKSSAGLKSEYIRTNYVMELFTQHLYGWHFMSRESYE